MKDLPRRLMSCMSPDVVPGELGDDEDHQMVCDVMKRALASFVNPHFDLRHATIALLQRTTDLTASCHHEKICLHCVHQGASIIRSFRTERFVDRPVSKSGGTLMPAKSSIQHSLTDHVRP